MTSEFVCFEEEFTSGVWREFEAGEGADAWEVEAEVYWWLVRDVSVGKLRYNVY